MDTNVYIGFNEDRMVNMFEQQQVMKSFNESLSRNKQILTNDSPRKLMKYNKSKEIKHDKGEIVVFFQDSGENLDDIANVQSINQGLNLITTILKSNKVTFQRLLPKKVTDSNGNETRITELDFGSPTAKFYIREY